MNRTHGPNVTRVESVKQSVISNNIPAGIAKLPGAIARLIAGPPMSERDRFQHDVAEARARSDWLRPQ